MTNDGAHEAIREELEGVIVDFLVQENRSTLRGRFFDVSKPSGKIDYAEWLANEILSLNAFVEKNREKK